jgi:RNA polymerase sigma-70 factor (ECF subfamily)
VSASDEHAPDGTLVAAAREGDAGAFAVLVQRYRGPLFKAAVSRLARAELAEEAVQETLLAAHRWLHTYDSRFSFRTWLWTILLNQCTRQATREARQPPAAAPGCGSGSEPAIEQLVDGRLGSPLDRLLAQESAERLAALLARLPEAQADALRLRFFGGLSFREIAQAMGSSEPGAKHRVKTGLLKLAVWIRGSNSDAAPAAAVPSPAAGPPD